MATHKASKFFGKIGLGRKSKALPHQPKVDYSAQKSSSVQELLPKSPTSERSRAGVSLSATSSGISDFDNTVTVSPGHKTDKGGHGGARPKEPPGGGLSPKQSTSERHSMISYTDDVGILGPAATDGPPPQFVDEYSDPYDLKKQIVENPELSGACAQAPLVDDDYSVPYEVKKLMREMKLREVGDGARARASRKAEGQLYDEPYGEGPGRFSSSPTRYTGDTRDYRPRDDYDEPWEWSAKQRSLFFQTQIGAEASSQNMSGANQKGTPLMTKRTSQPAGVGAEADENDVGGEEEEGGGEKSPDGPDYVNAPRGHKRMQNHADEDEDEEGYTHLREEFGARGPAAPAENTKVNKTENNKVPVPAEIPVGNYEEPWDLSFTQKDLEDKLKAASDRASRLGTTTSSGPAGDPAGASPQTQDPMPHETDLRPQEGYEKPWDWKPHKKDDRGEEGYEKPWDWKPHQKDDRPPEEYEEPWDQKVKDIERDLIKAKSAKEALKEREQTEDTRPMDEYDEPWDQKAAKNKALLSRTASDSSAKSGPCSGLAGAAAVDSPKRNARGNKANNESGWTAAAERVDPMLPLDQQGWYHGSISRVDAETLLRVHKEGSYLVRMSESNKLDFSLSLKSAQGFMHMKIVSRDSHFILGQFSQPFESIPQMIHHYSISKLPIKGAYHMSLLHPVINELL